jgi:hypothetical protein
MVQKLGKKTDRQTTVRISQQTISMDICGEATLPKNFRPLIFSSCSNNEFQTTAEKDGKKKND